MRYIKYFIFFSISILSCDVPDFEPLEYEFYNVQLDATQYPESSSYFLFSTENYIEKIEAGKIKDMSFYYVGNTLCQLDVNGKRDCIDIVENDQVIQAKDPQLQDLIRFEYSYQVDSLSIYRYFPFEENYFKVTLPEKDTTLFLPALIQNENRIIVSSKDSIFLDTTFFVSDQFMTIAF